MLRDIRFAVRQLMKSPGFALTTVATLALGIGALTTVMTWTNAVLFNPWPQVRDARSLRFLSATVLGNGGYSVHHEQVQFVKQQARSFSDAAGFDSTMVNLDLPRTQPEAIEAGLVNSNYFQLLGVMPQVGRFFQADANDQVYGAHDEMVLSDRLWREQFGADRNVVGRVVSINRHPFTVIGVAPAGFWGIYGGMAESAWLPLSALRDLSPDAPADPLQHEGLMAAVRLRPGVSDRTAAAELHTLARQFVAAQHRDQNGWDLNLDDSAHFQRGLFYGIGEMLPILMGASGLLMVLVCINIASLLGQRAAKRRREVAIRTALGAAPGRIARQVLVETGLLALAGGLAGWAVSTVLVEDAVALLPNFGVPLEFNLHSDCAHSVVCGGDCGGGHAGLRTLPGTAGVEGFATRGAA